MRCAAFGGFGAGGKRYGSWLEISKARLDGDGTFHVFLDRTPIGGFNDYAYLAPIGVQPPLPERDSKPPAEFPAAQLIELFSAVSCA
jgi:hypothetical protein